MNEAFPSRGTTAMRAREIKAFIHRSRVTDVMNALRTAGFRNVSLLDTRGLSQAFETKEREHSLGTGNAISPTVKLEVICDNESKTAEAIALIRTHAKTNEPYAGRIYISELLSGMDVGN